MIPHWLAQKIEKVSSEKPSEGGRVGLDIKTDRIGLRQRETLNRERGGEKGSLEGGHLKAQPY